MTKISIQGAASEHVDDQRLVNLSWYDLINNPPLPPKVSKEEMIEETEGKSMLMMFHFPDGSLSHTESGQMINGKFIPDEESLKLRREHSVLKNCRALYEVGELLKSLAQNLVSVVPEDTL